MSAIRERLEYALACQSDRGRREEDQARCAIDPAWWCARWVWTYDPRVSPAWMPLQPWPKQAEYLRWLALRLRGGGPSTVVKPRDVGASWLNAAFGVWCLLYLPGSSVGYSSRKLMYVDSGSPDSTFGKVRAILDRLPGWMRPQITQQTRTPAPLIRVANGAELKGEGGDNVGRGGRSGLYFVDEFAYYDRQLAVESAVAEAARVVVYCSTYGAPTDRFRRLTETEGVPCFRFAWTDDPRRGEGWLEAKRRVTDDVHFRRDILCDPDASLSGQVFRPEWLDACFAADFQPTGMMELGYDPAGDGSSRPMVAWRRGPCVVRLDEARGAHDEARATWVAREASRATVYYDASGGWGESARRVLGRYGVPVLGSAPVPDGVPDYLELAGNMRAALYLELRQRARNTWLREEGVDVAVEDCLDLPREPRLKAQLLSLTMTERSGGRLLLESKQTLRARGVASPDDADAVAYSFAGEVIGRAGAVGGY